MNLYDFLINKPIFNLLLTIYNFIGDFGLAIIIFTIIVKTVLWPITRNQLHQSKLMKKIQPELKKIKRNAKGNKQLETMQMMDLYKQNNIKPFRSMLSLFIQIPIFFALIHAINLTTNQELVKNNAYNIVAQMSRTKDMIESKTKFEPKLFGSINLSERAMPIKDYSGVFLLLIAVLSAGAQWYIIRQTQPSTNGRKLRDIMSEAADGKQADQSEINQIVSRQMSVMFPILMLITMVNVYGALSLYYFISNIIQVMQQRHVFNMDEKEMSDLANAKKTKKIKEAKIIDKKSEKTSGNIRRIKAKDNKRRKK